MSTMEMEAEWITSVQEGGRWVDSELAFAWVHSIGDCTVDRASVIFRALVERHEALRSVLLECEGRPPIWQVIPAADVAYRVSEIAGCPSSPGRGHRVEAVVDGHVLLGAVLLDNASHGLGFRVGMPAKYLDLGSLAILARDMIALSRNQGLREPVQHTQYVAQQRSVDEVGARGSDDAIPMASPRTDGLAAIALGTAGSVGAGFGTVSGYNDGARPRIDTLCRDHGVAVKDLVVAAWVATTWRLNANRDVAFNLLFDDRDRYPEFSDTVGVLSRYIPFSVPFYADMDAKSLISEVGRRRAKVFAALDQCSENDCGDRSFNDSIILACQSVVSSDVLERTTFHDMNGSPALSLQVLLTDETIRVDAVYRKRRYSEDAIRSVVNTYLSVMNEMCRNPESSIAALQLQCQGQRERILCKFGRAPEADELVRETAYELFDEQVRRTPDRLAVSDLQQSYSYSALDKRATSIERWLVASGLCRGAIVALFVGRNVDAIAAILGVWKAGMAYVPIDIDSPSQRIEFIMQDSRAEAILTEPDLIGRLPASNWKLCDLSCLPDVVATTEEVPTDTPIRKDLLAYIMYTSGTAGQPKGVMVEHGSVANLAVAQRSRIYCHHDPEWQGMRASLNAPFMFDGSVERITLLFSGFSLYVTDERTRRDPDAFLKFVESNRIEALDVTPTFMSMLIERGFFDATKHRPALVIVGGEAIPPALWRRLANSPIAFYNVYGPTETTVNATAVRIRGDSARLGLALKNCRIYILNSSLELVPVGALGEIYISGAGVARGYLNRPELTKERFLQNPYDPGDGLYSKLYKTGDLAYFREDGEIEFVSRADSQVKVRGYRLELGEVEAALLGHPEISQAVVVAQERVGGETTLIGYITGSAGIEQQLSAIRAEIGKSLPDYMLPSAIFVLPSLPVTKNGKIDYKALPKLGRDRPELVAYVEPSTSTERILSDLWAQALDVRKVGILDNFFDLGGTSVTAVRVVVQIRKSCGREIPIGALFEAPTIQELAIRIDAGECEARQKPDCAIAQGTLVKGRAEEGTLLP